MKTFPTFLLALVISGPVFAAPATAAADKPKTEVVTTEVLRSKPFARFLPDPVYPEELKKQGLAGTAKVEFMITSKGEITDVKVLESSHPAFGFAARDAVTRAKFSPAIGKNGEPVAVKLQVPFTFKPGK